MKKLPPIEKVHEAYTAIADGHVTFEDQVARVVSSNETKVYTVTWDGDLYTSNDNGSYWQGYAGYPMIAVLMLQGRLSLDREVAAYFKGINWMVLNEKHKAKYDRAVQEVMERLGGEGADCDRINNEINRVYRELQELDIETKRSKIKKLSL